MLSPGRGLSSVHELKRWTKLLFACRAEVSWVRDAHLGGSTWVLLGLGYGMGGCGSRVRAVAACRRGGHELAAPGW